jgi:hexulose-6-phosphate isomerase
MQGRLLPPVGNRIQAFPTGRWADELQLAQAVPLDAIEWIYEVQGADDNPISTPSGVAHLRALNDGPGVGVRSLCADYFMDRPLVRVTDDERDEREQVLSWLVAQCALAGIERIVLPFVDVSRISNSEDFDTVVGILRRVLPHLERAGVEIHLETDLPPAEFARLLTAVPHEKVRVNYDSGNSASLGYDPKAEFAAYGAAVGSIHIKDRVRGGGTVPLGTGNADFHSLFAEIRRTRYTGDFVLQVARGAVGDEVQWARQNLDFLRRGLSQVVHEDLVIAPVTPMVKQGLP